MSYVCSRHPDPKAASGERLQSKALRKVIEKLCERHGIEREAHAPNFCRDRKHAGFGYLVQSRDAANTSQSNF